MKHKNGTIPRLLTLVLLFAGMVSRASAASKGVVIAMGGGNGTAEIYEKWKSLVVERTLTLFSFQPRITPAMTLRQLLMG